LSKSGGIDRPIHSRSTILGFNGSPRSNWTTSQLVKKTLEGAASQGAITEYFDLNSVKFQPCQSCLICKKGPKYEGKCYFQDGLTPILDKIKKADGFVLGFPMYFGLPSALSHAFLERVLFSNGVYRKELTAYGKKIKTGIVVAAGAPGQIVEQMYTPVLTLFTDFMTQIFGSCERVGHYDAQQVTDYSEYDIKVCIPAEKYQHQKEQFPIDLAAAFELGKRLATK
jgi:multimeric flavodoxin WrbA